MTLSRGARASPRPRVAIVGAGIAGLACALELADHGIEAVVYESSGRIGGRMHSERSHWAERQVSEWCGELIDTGHATLLALAKRFDIPVVDLHAAEAPGATDTVRILDRHLEPAELERSFAAIAPKLADDAKAAGYPTTFEIATAAGRTLDAMSVRDWIDSRVPGGRASPFGRFLDVAYVAECGAETDQLSALNIVYLLASQPERGFAVYGGSDERFHLAGGNQRLPEAIARTMIDRVLVGWRLAAVARGADGRPALTFDVGPSTRTVVADHAVLTLPFAVLATLDLARAGFADRALAAIREQGRGRNGKLQLQFRDRLWRATGADRGVSTGETFTDAGWQNSWEVSRAQRGAAGILVDYTGGAVTTAMTTKVPYAFDGDAGVRDDARRFLSQIEGTFPGLASRFTGRATSSLPHLDPNLQLSYSFWKPGQFSTLCGVPRLPQGAIRFAGEHTSLDFQGYMNGGAEEGVRAAREIVAALAR